MAVKWIGDAAQELGITPLDAVEILASRQEYPMNGLVDEDRFKTLRLMRGGKRLETSGSQAMPVPDRHALADDGPVVAPAPPAPPIRSGHGSRAAHAPAAAGVRRPRRPCTSSRRPRRSGRPSARRPPSRRRCRRFRAGRASGRSSSRPSTRSAEIRARPGRRREPNGGRTMKLWQTLAAAAVLGLAATASAGETPASTPSRST